MVLLLIRLLKLFTAVMLATLLGLAVFYALDRYVPARHNPFAPLSISEPPGYATGLKVTNLKSDSEKCFKILADSDLSYRELADQDHGESCGFYGVAQLQKSTISYGGNITLTCPALVGLAIWERHELQPTANAIFGQKIVRIRHYGTYSCRNINNSRFGRRSQHSFANAIDISGFTLADGREISIKNDWGNDDSKGLFLKQIHRAACKNFKVVLGPNHNKAHHDHFHFDQGPSSICR